MSEPENHFTVFIRLPFKRGDFVDPPPVAWSAAKERELWDIISRQSKGNEIDWRKLAERFQITQQFLLQQAAWLYERQLSQVRAQMRRMGSRNSAAASPAPGSVAASMMGTQASKRPAGLVSRGPSRLSTQIPTTASPADMSVPSTPARSKTSLPLKPSSSGGAIHSVRTHQSSSSRPLSRKPSKDNEPPSRISSRRGSLQQQFSKSPGGISSSSEDETTSKPALRRSNPSATHRRSLSMRKSQHLKGSALTPHHVREQEEEDEEDDDLAFLPFTHTTSKAEQTGTISTDVSATLRGALAQPNMSSIPSSTRPALQRNLTSERVKPGSNKDTVSIGSNANNPMTKDGNLDNIHTNVQHQVDDSSMVRSLSSSTSLLPSATVPAHHSTASTLPYPSTQSTTTTTTSAPRDPPNFEPSRPDQYIISPTFDGATSTTPTTSTSTAGTNPNSNTTITTLPSQHHLHHHRQLIPSSSTTLLPTPLSPRQQAALAAAAGLSPRRRALNPSSPRQQPGIGHTHTGSESSPSMGSSFSDLDDASVTQSALEEALMSNMNALGSTTAGGTTLLGGFGGSIATGVAGTAGGGGGGGGGGGVAGALGSRVSGISQALRSRYFDGRGGGAGAGDAQR